MRNCKIPKLTFLARLKFNPYLCSSNRLEAINVWLFFTPFRQDYRSPAKCPPTFAGFRYLVAKLFRPRTRNLLIADNIVRNERQRMDYRGESYVCHVGRKEPPKGNGILRTNGGCCCDKDARAQVDFAKPETWVMNHHLQRAIDGSNSLMQGADTPKPDDFRTIYCSMSRVRGCSAKSKPSNPLQ